MNKLRLLSLFSGIGAFEKALTNIGINYELVGFSEIDKYAINSYCAIHRVDKMINLNDVSKINVESLPKDIDMITHGSPCQDYSLAGKGEGGDKGSGTRSSLMWYSIEIIKHCKPKYVIWENVKNVLSKKHKHNFEQYLKDLEVLGYTNYYQVLNAKNYGIPQNRERIYCISILGEHKSYIFPNSKELTIRLKDILEETVDEKYYLSEKVQSRFKLTKEIKEENNIIGTTAPDFRTIGQRDLVYNKEGIMGSLVATDYKQPKQILELEEPKIKQLGNVVHTGNWSNPQRGRVYSADGISPSLNTVSGGGLEPKIVVDNEPKIITEKVKQIVKVRKYPVDIEKLKKILKESKKEVNLTIHDISDILRVNITTVEHWFRNDDCFSIPSKDIWFDLKDLLRIKTDEFDKAITEFEYKENEYDMSNRVYNIEGISPTLTATGESGAKKIKIPQATKKGYIEMDLGGDKRVIETEPKIRIRKLTPLECWRLMGFSDEDFYKAQSIPTSNTQLYKQAGNSIVVNVLEEIFKQLFNL